MIDIRTLEWRKQMIELAGRVCYILSQETIGMDLDLNVLIYSDLYTYILK